MLFVISGPSSPYSSNPSLRLFVLVLDLRFLVKCGGPHAASEVHLGRRGGVVTGAPAESAPASNLTVPSPPFSRICSEGRPQRLGGHVCFIAIVGR